MITLDRIVTSVLLQKEYPIHWYLQCLKFASDCLRELKFDVMGTVKSKILTVNDYGAVKLPCDYVDFIKVGIRNGQLVMPVVQRNGLTRLNNHDEHGNKIVHEELEGYSWLWYDDVNTNGENIGRLFGHNVANQTDTFKILKERNEIQFDERYQAESIVLEYISDGQEADSATKVEPYAQACIEAYIFWKLKETNRSYGAGETQDMERKYQNALRILRARMNSITLEDIKRSCRKSVNIKS
jgi:hypothetical protein